jgi:nicotinamidase/pyrazinamidase
MRALVLIDLQYDFMPGGSLAVKDGDATVGVAVALMARVPFDLIVATQDWHPPGHRSFAVNNPGKRVGEMGELEGLPQVMWPAHCVQGTHGAELHAGLPIGKIDHVFQKGTDASIDSYSGFFDNGHKKATGMGEWLKAKGVDEVVTMGLATDYCVKFTTLDAIGLGFRATLVEDGCRGVDLTAGDSAAAIEAMRAAGAAIVRSGDLR